MIKLALTIFGEQVVGDAVALAGRLVAVERDRGLAVEVHRRVLAVEVIEHRRQRLAAIEHLVGGAARAAWQLRGVPGNLSEEGG